MISDSLLLITWLVKLFPLLIQADWLDMALLPQPDLMHARATVCGKDSFSFFFFFDHPVSQLRSKRKVIM